jgi:predicted RNase H-like HicB family nuclease
MKAHGYALVIERSRTGYSIYAPDLPGCVATAKTRETALRRMKEAIALRIAGLRKDGLPVPEPTSEVTYASIGS